MQIALAIVVPLPNKLNRRYRMAPDEECHSSLGIGNALCGARLFVGRRGPRNQMARVPAISFARLRALLKSQAGPSKWLGDYVPANMISDRNCPRDTRPSGLVDPYLKRVLQAQALTERVFLLLARHNPNFFDMHEQKILFFNPVRHPLFNHPTARGLQLPGLRGTLAIAKLLGKLKDHLVVRAPKDHPKYKGKMVPFPYVGDHLVYLWDSIGPYGVNWSIKASLEDFHRTFKRRRAQPSKEDRERAEFRHELERLYYFDGMIPTHQLTPSMVDKELSINLLNLYYWYARPPQSERAILIQKEVEAWYCEQIPRCRVMHEHSKIAAQKFGLNVYDAKWILKSGIFTRQIRIELFCVVADNLPLFPEIHDPFVRYADWFRRGE